MYKVKFLPANVEIEVPSGATIMLAAEKAGVFLENLCGGEGLCGKCRVQINGGKAEPDKYSLSYLSVEDIKKGYVLACQTTVTDNLTVMIPVTTSPSGDKILLEDSVVNYGNIEKISVVENQINQIDQDPLVQKYYLELPEPTLTDNISDIDRITRELTRHFKCKYYEITLGCLQNLADKLRQHHWRVTVTVARHNGSGKILRIEPGNTTPVNYGLAIDIGTTTVVVQLVDLQTGKIIDTEGSHNLQARYGEDVISRMVFACSRGASNQIHRAVITNINHLSEALIKENKIKRQNINAIVAAGNTTMSHFLLNLKPCAIRLEPYVPTAAVYPQLFTRELGIKTGKWSIIETVPGVASYVGGDIVAGVLASGLAEKENVSCLIDIGTNGEIVIGNNDWLVCCSASAGPAFEGAGAKFGMRATGGAIEKITFINGEIKYETIGNQPPRGICGSGLIDAIYELVNNGIIEQDGKFNFNSEDPRLLWSESDPGYILAFDHETAINENIVIFESEISNLIKSKGSVFAAIKSLIDYVGLSFSEMENIFVSGGFGSSLNIPKAIAIGLLPDIDPQKIKFIGNSSLAGARMILLSSQNLDKARQIARRMTNIELSNYPPFMNEFIAALFLPHTEAGLFPSVKYKK